jgi:myo-inositol-1(or 4)-monophosphatase
MDGTQELLSTAVELARRAGDVLRSYVGREKGVVYKGRANLVTLADKESEALIIKGIRERYPDHGVLAEESGASGAGAGTRWIIDPLDGTTNFAHQYPAFTVSIAAETAGVIVCGAVYDPVRDEMFSAARGQGAFLNGERMRVSSVERLAEGLLITGFPYNFRDRLDTVLLQFRGFLMEAQGVRRSGSAALDLCCLAAGRCDGFWELELNPWDTAAGTLIAAEAGARVTNFDGKPFSIEMREILASNGRIHEEMMAVVRGT